MYIKIDNGQVVAYPYALKDLLAENPNVSFPASFSEDLLAQYGVFPVHFARLPEFNTLTQLPVELPPIFTGDRWLVGYSVIDRPHDEVVDAVKATRGALLSSSDWVVLKNYEAGTPVPVEWVEYRQALRDITKQEGYPYNVVWPKEPGQLKKPA